PRASSGRSAICRASTPSCRPPWPRWSGSSRFWTSGPRSRRRPRARPCRHGPSGGSSSTTCASPTARATRCCMASTCASSLAGGVSAAVRERGGNLSVGQKQLLSFARALAYDPAVLVLDEATSSVDTETELLIQGALGRLLAGRTSLVIAHRLSTIVGADRILVMHHGRIVEEGTHRALLQERGIYHRLYQLQFGQETPGSGRPTLASPEVAS